MNKQEALKIIRMIAEGDDPYRDKTSTYSLPEHDPRTLRAICKVISSIFPIDDNKNGIFSFQPLILDNFLKGLVKDFIKKLEKNAIIEAAKKNIFKKSKAASILGITYDELISKIKEHNIEDIIKELERDEIVEALTKANFKKDETAEILGITFSKLLSMFKEHDINKEFLVLAIETDYQDQLNQISLNEYLEIIENNAIIKALEKTNGLQQKAAELLGTSFRTLRYRINKLGIDSRNIPTSISSPVNSDFFEHSWKDASLDEFLKVIEKKVIEMALNETDYKKMGAAERLGISFRTLRYRIDKLGIE